MHIRAGAKGSVGFVIFKEKLLLETLDLQTPRGSEAKLLPPGCPNRVNCVTLTARRSLPGLSRLADILMVIRQLAKLPLPDFASNPSWWTPRQVQVPGLVQIAGLGERGCARQERRIEVGLG